MDRPVAEALDLLTNGEIEIEGRMPWSSNATFLVHVRAGEQSHPAIYKPVRGERPLWDFEPGLHRRELAAYRLSEACGLHLVPPTVIRDGPLGEGSLQWFVDADHRQHYFTIHEQRPDLHDALREIAAFDIVANNTDRKSGHVLLGDHGQIWGIDHGLCFAGDFKLRTVIWEFAGDPLSESVAAWVAAVAGEVPAGVVTLLSDHEVDAIAGRAERLARAGTLPIDPTGRRYPWPLV